MSDYVSPYKSVSSNELPDQELSKMLGITANALNQYDLMRAATRCKELIGQIQNVQLIHVQNMCRIANRLEAAVDAKELCNCSHLLGDHEPSGFCNFCDSICEVIAQ